jgi:hypothetical protein
VKRDHEIQALSSYRSYQSFTIDIRPRCPDRRTQYPVSEAALHFRVQLRRKDRIGIVNEEPIGMVARNGVPQLLEGPFRRRMSRQQCRMRRLPIYVRGDFVRELLTVKQLLEALKKFPLDAKVFYEMGQNGAGTIGKAQYVKVRGEGDRLGVLLDR